MGVSVQFGDGARVRGPVSDGVIGFCVRFVASMNNQLGAAEADKLAGLQFLLDRPGGDIDHDLFRTRGAIGGGNVLTRVVEPDGIRARGEVDRHGSPGTVRLIGVRQLVDAPAVVAVLDDRECGGRGLQVGVCVILVSLAVIVVGVVQRNELVVDLVSRSGPICFCMLPVTRVHDQLPSADAC